MPQLVKGGKHVFGWSRVGDSGRIKIPPEALAEYGLKESNQLILMPGSKTSGGFGLGSQESLPRSPWGDIADAHPKPGELQVPEGKVFEHRGKPYCRVKLLRGSISISPGTLAKYGIETGKKLLVIRGSGLALGFAVKGPIVEEAKQHPELKVY